ncbi:antitoxin Xre-like helix-turn-helix domain-containing protein [Sphingobium limneticum]|nr:antitoxin Xre-like helix-turn-helix domain-containing protein [Sphingobium limneticum]
MMMATQFQSVEALLGLEVGINAPRLALPSLIESGLPVAALDHLADSVVPGDARFKFRLIPKATLERRRKSASKRLTSEEGDRLARLAKVFSFALDIYKEPERAREFLGRPHPMLDGKAPLDVTLATGPGADLVINLLGRAAYGGGV